MIKVLVKHGSNVNRKDEEGTPPLHSAVYGNTEWTASICDYLIEQGAVTPFMKCFRKIFNEIAINSLIFHVFPASVLYLVKKNNILCLLVVSLYYKNYYVVYVRLHTKYTKRSTDIVITMC